MIRSPIGLRLNFRAGDDLRVQIREAASLGARGLVLDAAGELAPHRLTETGRRELRHLLRTTELSLIAMHLPTRRSLDRNDALEDRLARADRAFELAYELGARIALIHPGPIPSASAPARQETLRAALTALAQRADRRGVRLAIEVGDDPPSAVLEILQSLPEPRAWVSIDPGALATRGEDAAAAVRTLAAYVAHAYASDPQDSKVSISADRVRSTTGHNAIDWEEYLGALEEADYRGFLTVWPSVDRDVATQFRDLAAFFGRF